jgi:hypothetical protein
MTLNIQLNSSALKSDGKCVIHSLPCKIVHDGSANVSTFFTPYIEDNNGGEWFKNEQIKPNENIFLHIF